MSLQGRTSRKVQWVRSVLVSSRPPAVSFIKVRLSFQVKVTLSWGSSWPMVVKLGRLGLTLSTQGDPSNGQAWLQGPCQADSVTAARSVLAPQAYLLPPCSFHGCSPSRRSALLALTQPLLPGEPNVREGDRMRITKYFPKGRCWEIRVAKKSCRERIELS